MHAIPQSLKLIHEKALTVSSTYKKSEADLLAVIIQVRDHKVFRYFACTSVFEYCVQILKLDPGVVYGFTAVAKKIKEVPELQEKIQEGGLNVSTAKRITSVLTNENKNEWFAKAQTLPMRKLESEVAKVNPKAAVKEKASYISDERLRLELGLDEKLMTKVRRVQDLESQSQRRSVSLEETLAAMTAVYLAKFDPLEKAKRAKWRAYAIAEKLTKESASADNIKSRSLPPTVKNPSTWKELTKRKPISAKKIHQINLRDQGECQHLHPLSQMKCGKTRFIEIHHQNPVSLGGGDDLHNLITLCSEHHKQLHQ